MASINITMSEKETFTAIPNIFIDKYMPYAIPTYSNIYIYCLRNSINKDISINIKDIAKIFNILESDVINSFKYWEDKNLINLKQDVNGSLNIEFLYLNDEKETKKTKPNIQEQKNVSFKNKPTYSPKEIELYKERDSIKRIFAIAEASMGKLLSSNDLSTIYGFYDWLRLPLDVIEKLLIFCNENNHKNIRYIEKVALDWTENNIDTVEKATEYINGFNKNFREILKAFGQGYRNPTNLEIEYMKNWIENYNMSIDIIIEACNRTILKLGKPQFKYTDKILESWHKQNVKILEDIKYIENNFYKDNEEKYAKNTKTQYEPKNNYKKNGFNTYEEHNRDFSELEKLEQEYLRNDLKGR